MTISSVTQVGLPKDLFGEVPPFRTTVLRRSDLAASDCPWRFPLALNQDCDTWQVRRLHWAPRGSCKVGYMVSHWVSMSYV